MWVNSWIGILVGVSYIAAQLALNIPAGWVALSGLAPLALGILKLKSLHRNIEQDGSDSDDTMATQEHSAAQRLHSQVLAVSSITVANGGDNLGVYIPLFASSAIGIHVYVGTFLLMTGLWCALGYYAVHNPILGSTVRRYGPVSLPFVLIALGIYILSGSLVLFE